MDHLSNTTEKRQSTLIMAMRFPLIVMVIICHSLGFSNYHISLSTDKWNIYHFFSELISHNLCQLTVCWFFVFSGYLFFYNLPQNGLTGEWLITKWKRRFWTLLIPYFIWNTLPMFAKYVKEHFLVLLGMQEAGTAPASLFSGFNPLPRFLLGPANFPLWFMRDLIIMSILAPAVYFIFKHIPRRVGIIVLFVLFLLPFETPVLTWRGYFFFSLGAFLGIHKLNMLSICRKVKWHAAIMAVILLITATLFNDAPFHDWLLRVFYPFGMITFMNIIDRLIDNKKWCEILCKLSSAVFFIYAVHEIYILGWTKGMFLRIFGDGLLGTWIRYLFVPVVVLFVCLGLYYLLNKIMPRTLAFICGGRSNKVVKAK